jgi:hypothetical protein
MRLRTESPTWFNEDKPELQAKCVNFPATPSYDPWFGDVQGEDMDEVMEETKRICLGLDDGNPCPLLDACREFALINNERSGVWGGTTPAERVEIRRARRLDWQQNQE